MEEEKGKETKGRNKMGTERKDMERTGKLGRGEPEE